MAYVRFAGHSPAVTEIIYRQFDHALPSHAVVLQHAGEAVAVAGMSMSFARRRIRGYRSASYDFTSTVSDGHWSAG